MRLRVFVAALAALVAVPGAAQAQTDRDRERVGGILRPTDDREGIQVVAVGRISALSPLGRGFTLVSGRQTFQVTSTERAIDQRPARFRVGDRVRVSGELLETGRIAAEDIDVLGGGAGGRVGGSTISGTIRNISADEQRMTLQTTQGLVRVAWDEDTEFVRNRNRDSVRGFRVGDSIRVVGRRRPGGEVLARRVLFGGVAGWENGGVGEIISLNARSQTAEVDFDGQVETVDLRNATIRRRERRLDVDDLRLGFDVRVQGTRPGARGPIQATTVDVVRQLDDDRADGRAEDRDDLRTYEGTVDELFTDAFRLRLTTGESIRVQTGGDTRIVRGTTNVAFSGLRRGQRVRVRGRVMERENRRDLVEALRVELL